MKITKSVCGLIYYNYLIVAKSYDKELFGAVDIDDLLWTAAQYYGHDNPVLQFGIHGCNTTEEKVEMYNTFARFSDFEIEQIYEIGERIYG